MWRATLNASWALVFVCASALLATSCQKESCLTQEKGCVVASPCGKLDYTCSASVVAAQARVLTAEDPPPKSRSALAAVGDVQLSNDQVVAVIDAIGSRHDLAVSGGTLIDLSVAGQDDDALNQISQAVGILPADQVQYTSMRIVANGPGVAAVQFLGQLFGHSDVFVATRYEVRSCEPGVRVRTEVVNNTDNPQFWALLDAWYWSNRPVFPFTPFPGGGFNQESFSLLTINDAFVTSPFMAGSTNATPDLAGTSYSVTACNQPSVSSFESETVSGVGLAKSTVAPHDYRVYERFIAVAPTADIAGSANQAMHVRAALFGEKYVTLSGRVVRDGGTPIGGRESLARVQISTVPEAGASAAQRTPWTEVVPAADGTFSASVPAGQALYIEVDAFGTAVRSQNVAGSKSNINVGDLVAPLAGQLTFQVTDDSNKPIAAEAFFVAADAKTATETSGSLYGQAGTCTPYLGFPNGGSPACNRVLIGLDGMTTFQAPMGNYYVYFFAGPFLSIDRELVAVEPGGMQSIPVTLHRLPLLPSGTLSADLHVHGLASFDSGLPDSDRVLSFAAVGIDVLAATDHDVIGDYTDAMSAAGLTGQIAVIDGVETTGQIPYLTVPGSTVPKDIGHFNFWPMQYSPTAPRKGAPDDELCEPGELFGRIQPDPAFSAGSGIRQLNHPWEDPQFGRDLGFPRAIGFEANRNLPTYDDGTADGIWVRTPAGANYPNNDFDAQEVMNGTDNGQYQQYRALWFFLNNQGELHTGTANADSHGLTDDNIGSPRNIVTTSTTVATFDVGMFNAAIRNGETLGTNGPIIDVTLDGMDGMAHTPSHTSFQPATGANLTITVMAAPWVPIEEVRVIVNGQTVKSLTPSVPANPLGYDMADLQRLSTTLPLSSLLTTGTDGWIVVEAGAKLQLLGDLDGDGIPDTSDNNGDGVVNRKDVAAGQTTGPITPLPLPVNFNDPLFHFSTVVPGARPASFTNPLLVDWAGDGFTAPGYTGSTGYAGSN